MSWRVGRGKRRHEVLGEYLLAKFLTTGVVQYVGPRLLTEVLERESPAAVELYEIVNDADVKSASCAVEVEPAPPRKEESSPQKLTTDNLIENIRTGIREKWIPINEWHSAGYVVGEITYLALPRLIECLAKRGLYRADPKNRIDVQSFVDAFANVPFVRKRPDGSVKRTVRMDQSRPSFQAVALKTAELFQATDVPQWVESGIHEDPNHA